jgi:hypothetical protein
MNFAIHAKLANPPRDQLRVLTAKIEDEDLFSVDIQVFDPLFGACRVDSKL